LEVTVFGERLDYLILRRLAHTHNIATEDELNARASYEPSRVVANGVERLHSHMERFAGFFPTDMDLRYLDMGCGTGELTLGLAVLGYKHVTGVDFVPRNIVACQSTARQLDMDGKVQFHVADLNTWTPREKYDVLVSFDAFEHIDDPGRFLRKMADFATPDGMVVLGFGPLFHSPFGDHMSGFFTTQIPWRGVLFSEKAVMRVRRECYRPGDPAERYRDIVGGLNLMRYSEFLDYATDAGWQIAFLALNPRLNRSAPLRLISAALTRIPFLRDYFVFSVYAILRRSSVSSK
jgi:SAM-dependent methyltransferase